MIESNTFPVFPFPDNPADADYCLFPVSLENDDLVFFHGTAESNLTSILNIGFAIPQSSPSISFAKSSSLSLRYASEARCTASPNGVVIAVRYSSIERPHITQEAFGLHVYSFDEPPTIIGYCIVPQSYVFI